jgi:uncharacterized protein (TIGR01619 family)
MPEGWNFYLCTVNDVLASIALDLGLRGQIPNLSKPELLWVWVYFKSPRPDGLSSDVEFDTLIAIEKQITKGLEQEFRAILSGRITTAGRREFYYYGAHSVGFTSAVADALGRFPDYEFDCGVQMDPGWNQYLNVLYPSDEQRQRIENRSVLEVLEREGDPLTAPRDISHWIYFHTKGDRDAFWDAIRPLEYRLQSQPDNPDGTLPFGLCIVRFQSVKQDAVDDAVIELFRRAREFHGEYDGWEAEVISQ